MARSLLRDTPSQPELVALLKAVPRKPLLPPWDAAPWREAAARPLVRELYGPMRERALSEIGLETPLPELSDALYADFKKTGIRLRFERPYFERRRRLARAAAALLLGGPDDPQRGRLVAALVGDFDAVSGEVSWSLPAHVDWKNESGKDPFQIDLFCAETANLVGEVLDVFGALLPAPLAARVRERLRTHIFENYLKTDFYWITSENNWNSVCHQGVLGAALSQWDDSEGLAAMLRRAAAGLPRYLKGFAADGGTSEGVGYWNYGFGWFAVLNEQLEARTGGALSLFDGEDRPQIAAIARFGPMMALHGGKLVNFADGGPEGVLPPQLLSYLGRRLED
ncbi:MAG TPA: hypothetical protein VIM58_07460, partial [Candidatus Methylacidiphilales bacterium]